MHKRRSSERLFFTAKICIFFFGTHYQNVLDVKPEWILADLNPVAVRGKWPPMLKHGNSSKYQNGCAGGIRTIRRHFLFGHKWVCFSQSPNH